MRSGIDSSYLLYLAKEMFNLRPLVFHVDTGCNSDIAVNNIQVLETYDAIQQGTILLKTDMLSVLEKRSENGFPTLFINCVTADIEFQKQLENYGSAFLIDPSKDAIERSIMKWRNDTKLVDQNVEKPPVTQHPEGNLRDQTVPKILKEINGRLSDGQQYFVRNLASLTDGIAKALSPAEGPLFFDSLKKIVRL